MSEAVVDGVYRPFPAYADWAPSFDPRVVDAFAARLADRRETVSAAELARAVNVATRYAAVDTGAIEGLYTTNRGFTRTIATQSATWEAALDQHGATVARAIADALAGYEMVLDAVTGSQPVSESWVRQLHEVLCASQGSYQVFTAAGPQSQPLPKGTYKTMPNNPTSGDTGRVHHYAPVDDTAPEMQRLLEQLRSHEFAAAHPVLQAAYAHYAFVCVHPFADGNGRVSRALASLFLYRAPGVPLVVFADQKNEYIDALELADDGDPRSFVGFIEQRVVDAVELVLGSIGAAARPALDRSVEALARESSGLSGLSHGEMDEVNARLGALVTGALRAVHQNGGLAEHVVFRQRAMGPAATSPPSGFRKPGSTQWTWRAHGPPPAGLEFDGLHQVWTRMAGQPGPELRVTTTVAGETLDLDVNLREVHPVETELLNIKLASWADDFFAALLAELQTQNHAALITMGYLPRADDEEG